MSIWGEIGRSGGGLGRSERRYCNRGHKKARGPGAPQTWLLRGSFRMVLLDGAEHLFLQPFFEPSEPTPKRAFGVPFQRLAGLATKGEKAARGPRA